jgi:tRNA threonylcarbamoyl adenosine modification protein YeaZ
VTTIFSFDAATATASCALVRDGEVIAEAVSSSRRLLETAAELMRDAGVAMGEIDAVVVGTGPGSFTGVRIALATARGLCAALDLPAAGVSTLHAFAGGRAVIDARRGEVFTTGPLVARPDELDVAGERLIGDGAIRYRSVFEAAGAEVPPDDDPVHVPSAVLLAAHAGAFGAVELIDPLYLRLPDAVATR